MPNPSAGEDVSEIMLSDGMGCERPDPSFGGRARAPQITRINSRTDDRLSGEWN